MVVTHVTSIDEFTDAHPSRIFELIRLDSNLLKLEEKGEALEPVKDDWFHKTPPCALQFSIQRNAEGVQLST